jgi:hypothetical protein
VNTEINFRFRKMLVNSCLTAELAASQKELSSTELVICSLPYNFTELMELPLSSCFHVNSSTRHKIYHLTKFYIILNYFKIIFYIELFLW